MLRAMSVSPRAVTKGQKRAALAIAAVSDLVQMGLFPIFIEGALSPWELALDAVTAIALLVVLGVQWRLAIALALELVPAVDLFPTWTALVMTLPTRDAPALPASSGTPAAAPSAAAAEDPRNRRP